MLASKTGKEKNLNDTVPKYFHKQKNKTILTSCNNQSIFLYEIRLYFPFCHVKIHILFFSIFLAYLGNQI